jgi:hypothetical protein
MSATFTQLMYDSGKEAGSQFGKGVRQAAGWQSKSELLQEIHESGDYTTREGMMKVLEKVRKVDFNAYTDMLSKVTKAESDMMTAQAYADSTKSTKAKNRKENLTPLLEKEYESTQRAIDLKAWVENNLPDMSSELNMDKLTPALLMTKIAKTYGESASKGKGAKRVALLDLLKKYIEASRDAYVAAKLNTTATATPKQEEQTISKDKVEAFNAQRISANEADSNVVSTSSTPTTTTKTSQGKRGFHSAGN